MKKRSTTTARPTRTDICWENIDPGIVDAVRILRANGVETTESCQGGQGHPFPEPTVRFCGELYEGPRAFGVARMNGLRVNSLRRTWSVIDGELVGPEWEMVFYQPDGAGAYPVEQDDGTVKWEWR